MVDTPVVCLVVYILTDTPRLCRVNIQRIDHCCSQHKQSRLLCPRTRTGDTVSQLPWFFSAESHTHTHTVTAQCHLKLVIPSNFSTSIQHRSTKDSVKGVWKWFYLYFRSESIRELNRLISNRIDQLLDYFIPIRSSRFTSK